MVTLVEMITDMLSGFTFLLTLKIYVSWKINHKVDIPDKHTRCIHRARLLPRRALCRSLDTVLAHLDSSPLSPSVVQHPRAILKMRKEEKTMRL